MIEQRKFYRTAWEEQWHLTAEKRWSLCRWRSRVGQGGGDTGGIRGGESNVRGHGGEGDIEFLRV
ncbi:MAG UNVERIFIED_CONTAM: hypothetical protein LVR29_18445 [Microcystis novacekii LVE1205-3]